VATSAMPGIPEQELEHAVFRWPVYAGDPCQPSTT
jgi:hypothetical protein